MEPRSLSYREVIPNYFAGDQWEELTLNIGSAQSTLQDIKIAEKAGGYCYKQLNVNHNRFIYWRSNQDVVELTEVSLDYNLYHNNLRIKFVDAPVLSVSIAEKESTISVLVATVCSVHCITFQHPDAMLESNSSSITTELSKLSMINDYKNLSIFYNASSNAVNKSNSFYVIETLNGAPTNNMPHTACCFMSPNTKEAYFALACQSNLMLYVMDCDNGRISEHSLKEHHLMPRILTNIKDKITGKSDSGDSECVSSLEFVCPDDQIYLLSLYRNDDLRVWATATQMSVASISCNRGQAKQRQQGPQSNALRKINEHRVCAFISHTRSSKFVIIDVLPLDESTAGVELKISREIHSLALDLTAFDVSESRIWSLWSNAEGEFSVSNYSLHGGLASTWVTAAMEPPPDRYSIGIEEGMDPREAYCSYILHAGKFDRDVIAKALFMFRRSGVRFDAKSCSLNLLKEHVYAAVEEEIQNDLKDFQSSDDDYVETATRLWERFFTCCEQYHMKNCQPTGLFILPSVDAVCLIKKNNYSLLRPCESLEHLMLSGDNVDMDSVLSLQFAGNEMIGQDLVNLVAILANIEKCLPDDVKIEMDKKLYRLEMPSLLIEKIARDIVTGGGDHQLMPPKFLDILKQKVGGICDLRSAMSLLLDSLRIDNGNPEAMQTESLYPSRLLSALGNLFGSEVGLSIMCETVKQTAMIRFAICRSFLIFAQILMETFMSSMSVMDAIRSHFMSDAFAFLQCYYAMVWIAEQPVNLTQLATHEAARHRLINLKLIKPSEHILATDNKQQYSSLLQLFLKAKGLNTAIGLCAENLKELTNVSWQLTLLPLNTIISQLIWPISNNFIFGEWLFGTCLHVIIDDYVRLLNNWCEWNICSRQFMLATSLLECGDTQKAYDLFLQASGGILKEQFLSDRILQNTPIAEELQVMEGLHQNDEAGINLSNRAVAQYYLKVIELFEQHNSLDHIVSLANKAIGLLGEDDPQLPMFQSIDFNNHLQLEHYNEAYHSLTRNVELSRRKDCLRQLVVTLFQRKRFDLLTSYSYVNLQQEFEKIVKSKARSLPIEHNEIYDFLYAYHVNNNNMRNASSVMYEHSLRLKLESDTVDAMQARCNSLLMCLNCLHLIDERYRWIAKPVLQDESMDDNAENADCEIPKKVVVLEISDIKRELLQTVSLIRLAAHRQDAHTFLSAGPQELVFIMANSGLYTDAIKLAKGFSLSLMPIFDSLTAACVRSSEESTNEVWAWLQENDLADLPHRNNGSDVAWLLLQKLVEENEEENSTEIRKSVVTKLCSLNAFIPQWLINAYKLANIDEFLSVLVKHYRYLEAAALAVEMLNAMIGVGSEYFSFKHSIAVTNPDMCLPVNTLDLLLLGLQQNAQEDIEYKQALTELDEILDKYLKIAQRTAQDKLHYQLNKG